jgi:hypothetical protein
MTILYRQLQTGEWDRLQSYFDRIGRSNEIPHPDASIVAVAINDHGDIVGVLVQQLQWHREPLILDSPYVRFDRLNDVLNEAFAPFPGTVYYAMTDNREVAQMALRVGMVADPDKVVLKGRN